MMGMKMCVADKGDEGPCKAGEELKNKGTRNEYCGPNNGQCGPGRRIEMHFRLNVPECRNAPAGTTTSTQAVKSSCPPSERAVNAGTRSEYCAPVDGRCAFGRTPVSHSSLPNAKMCVKK
jgi:hypothetical protein